MWLQDRITTLSQQSEVSTHPKTVQTCNKTVETSHNAKPNQSKTYGQKAGGQQEDFLCVSFSSDTKLRNEAQICDAFTFQVSVQILCKSDIWMSPSSAETKLYAPVLSPRGSIHLGILQSTVCRRMNTALTTQSTGDTVCRLWWKDFLKQEKIWLTLKILVAHLQIADGSC